MVRAPAVLAAVPFLTGAAASIALFDNLGPRFSVLCAAAALTLLLASVGAALQGDTADSVAGIVIGCLFAGASLGADAARLGYFPPVLRWYEAAAPIEPVVVEGVLAEDAAVTPSGVSLTLAVTRVHGFSNPASQQPASLGGIRLSIAGTLTGSRIGDWRAGRTIRAPAFLRRPSTYLNPGTRDERRSLARRGIVLVGTIKSAALVEVIGRGNPVNEAAAVVRAWIRRRIAAHVGTLSPVSAGVATAVMIGDRSGLSVEDERRLQDAGTYHVIAISGGNIAVLAILALFLCRAAWVPSRAAALMTAAGLVFYGILTGGTASVARAVTVAVVLLCARALDHRAASLNALAIAAVALVASSPVVVFDAGFILSFGATVGILLGVPLFTQRKIEPRGRRRRLSRRIGLGLAALGAATVCAEVALVPVGASLFARVPVAGLLLNFVAIPLMTIVQIAGLLIVAFAAWWNAAASIAGAAAHLAAFSLLHSARLVEVAPWLTLDVPPPAWWLVAAYYACALGLLARRPRRLALPSFGVVILTMLTAPTLTRRDSVPAAKVPLRVVILDVGQGDATAVLLPTGRAVLVDAGGLAPLSSPGSIDAAPAFDVGERVVVPSLRALRVARLEALVVSHGDPDHVMGAPGVLRHFATRSVWEGVPVPRHAGLQALSSTARERAMTWRTVQAGDAERFGDVEMRVLHPPLPEWERQRVRNEDSVVLELRLGNVSIILPGDIGREGEAALLSRVESGRLVVLKAPHHGSATSSTTELLNILRPAAVVFSCGRDNRFGHPHPAVVARYKAAGAEIFSTADDGAVFIDTDGTKAEVFGWRGRKAILR